MHGICECEVSIAAGSWARAEIGGTETRQNVSAALRVPLGRFHITTFLPTGGDQQSQHLSAHNLGPILLVAGLFCAAGLTTLYITTPFSRLLMTVSDSRIGVVSRLRRKS
jgi:hypothetical protein